MPSGMQHLLKSLGVNPEEIMASVESFKTLAQKVQDTQVSIDAKLDNILANQAIIISKLDSYDSEIAPCHVGDVLNHVSETTGFIASDKFKKEYHDAISVVETKE